MRASIAAVCCFLLLWMSGIDAGGYGPKNKHLKKPIPIERQSFNPEPVKLMDPNELPTEFDWGAIPLDGKPTSLLQPSWNQHIPQASSACDN